MAKNKNKYVMEKGCKKCGGDLHLKKGSKAKDIDGNVIEKDNGEPLKVRFWGCENYSKTKCDYTRPCVSFMKRNQPKKYARMRKKLSKNAKKRAKKKKAKQKPTKKKTATKKKTTKKDNEVEELKQQVRELKTMVKGLAEIKR